MLSPFVGSQVGDGRPSRSHPRPRSWALITGPLHVAQTPRCELSTVSHKSFKGSTMWYMKYLYLPSVSAVIRWDKGNFIPFTICCHYLLRGQSPSIWSLLCPVNDWHPYSKQCKLNLSLQDRRLHCGRAAKRGREWKEVPGGEQKLRPWAVCVVRRRSLKT